MNTSIVHHIRRCALLILLLLSTGLVILLSGSDARPALAHPEPVQTRKDPAAPQPPPDVRCAPEWSEWQGPDTGNGHTQLMGIAALSRVDVWAVGAYLAWPYRPLITHWDGSAWSTVTVPDLPGAAVLRDISAISPSDIWAVGYYDSGNRRWRPLTLHWNGEGWSQTAAPDPGSGSSYLFGVKALATNDVWAVGSACCVRYLQQTLALHWDGNTWSAVPTSSIEGSNNSFYSVDGIAANDVWAVGASGKYDARQT